MKAEASANMKALLLSEQLGMKGMVVIVKERVEGFIFGQKVNEDVCIMLHGKTNLKVKGLSPVHISGVPEEKFCRLQTGQRHGRLGRILPEKLKNCIQPLHEKQKLHAC